jgi:glycine betaine/proline transport system ATP-binding protein
MVFITHDLSEALRLGDRIAIMRDGRFVQVGTPQEVVTQPADDYVRNFVRDIPRSHVVTVEAVMRPAIGSHGPVVGDVLEGTKVRDVVGLLATSELPVAVVDHDGARVGVVTRSDALGVIAGEGD